MTSPIEIVGMGSTHARSDGAAVSFVLETRSAGPLHLACTSEGLDILIGCLIALQQEAAGKRAPQTEGEMRLDLIPIERIGCGPAAN
jgi:hypothetical protein